jgi:hypothetical protein
MRCGQCIGHSDQCKKASAIQCCAYHLLHYCWCRKEILSQPMNAKLISFTIVT